MKIDKVIADKHQNELQNYSIENYRMYYHFFYLLYSNLRFYQPLKEVSPSFITFLHSLISTENISIAFVVKYFNATLIIVQITNSSKLFN